ncbi:Gfo/Idh/MocA family protein [Jatrophihabitans sp.]|uniref:Gfo/Idh/MocA family protein n=1 Tax=Jatrophihabitans sp. TaxID=1932789 RepID=UPI002BBA5FAC|nr:Gfo/Idh/MocA family oxidoreductase [Jatrophihabitans sp.]
MAASEESPVRWGVLGAGGIAGKFCTDLVRTPGNVLAAVAARDAGRAADFAARFGAPRSYGSYAELAGDQDCDVVYIATTHPGHREQALLAITAGKAVLIEKPVCLNAADAREVFGAAAAAGVFAMEAMWMRTNPLIRQAQQLVADGAIGALASVRAELGLGRPYDPAHRLYDLANGGGALLDLGIYPVTFGWIFGGPPRSVAVTGTLAGTGSDATVAMQWSYPDGRDAQLWCSAPLAAPFRGLLVGTEGWIRTEGRFYRPTALTVCVAGEESRIEDPLEPGDFGYSPEIAEVARCLRAGLTESPLVPAADTVAILDLLDGARAELGVRYPGE